jgi:BolA protein
MMHPDIEKYHQALMVLKPISIEFIDDSAQHSGHLGQHGSGPSHLTLNIVSESFSGLNRVSRHRLVYDMLKEWMPYPIHALVINAKTSIEK